MATRRTAIVESAAIAVGFLIEFFVLEHSIWADAEYRAAALRDLLWHGRLSSYRYSYAGPLFSTPLELLDHLAGREWFLPRYNVLVLLAGCAILWLTQRQRTSSAVLRAMVLILLAASMFPFHLGHYYGEVFSATAAAVGIALIHSGRPLAGWTAFALAVVNQPPMMVGMGIVAALEATRERRWRQLLPVALTLALILAENWIRRGSPLDLGYGSDGAGRSGVMPYSGLPGFSFPFLFGVLAILFSFGRGLAFFAPSLWLSFFPRDRDAFHRTYASWMWLLFGMIVVYARWWAWHGAIFWGPRFFLFAAFPAAWLLASELHGRGPPLRDAAALAALAFSTWVGIDSAAFHVKDVYPSPVFPIAEGALNLYTLEFGPLFRPFLHWTPPDWREWTFIGWALLAFLCLAEAPASRMAAAARDRLARLRQSAS